MSNDEKAKLLDDIKNHIDITWSDEQTEKKLTEYMEGGIKKIDSLTGVEKNYLITGIARDLLFTYCLYAFNKVTNEFEKNYLSDILKLQIQSEVEEYDHV